MARNYSGGSLSKNHGIWRATISYQEDGKQHRLTKSTGIKCYPGADNRNKAKAEAIMRRWREELVLADAEQNPEGSEMPFFDYCERFLSMHHVKATTMSGYKANMTRLRGTQLGATKICEVTGDAIRKWEQDQREDGLSETTIGHAHAFLSMILKYATAEGTIPRNPILSVRSPKRVQKPVNSLTPEQRATILDKMDKCANYQLSTSVRLALLTGMRRGEICALRWCDVDLEDRVIHVTHALTKDHGFKIDNPKDPAGGNTLRDIPFGNALAGYLRAHKMRQRTELASVGGGWVDTIFVVGNPLDGTFFNPETLGRQWSMLVDAEGWTGTQGKKVRFHDLRHCFATLAIRYKSLDIMALSKILGHRDASMTLNVYADALEEAKREGMDAFDEALKLDRKQGGPRGRHMRR